MTFAPLPAGKEGERDPYMYMYLHTRPGAKGGLPATGVLFARFVEGDRDLRITGSPRAPLSHGRTARWVQASSRGSASSARHVQVCSDMRKAYLRVVKEQAGQARHVLDRFHIVQKLGKAIDAVRAAEAKQLKVQGKEPVLKSSRAAAQAPAAAEKQEPKLAELLKLNLRTVRAYLLKEDFQGPPTEETPLDFHSIAARWKATELGRCRLRRPSRDLQFLVVTNWENRRKSDLWISCKMGNEPDIGSDRGLVDLSEATQPAGLGAHVIRQN